MPSSTGYTWNAAGISTPDSGTLASIASAATLALDGSSRVYKVTGTTGITAITGVPVGGVVTLVFAGAVTVTHSATLKLAGAADFTSTADDCLSLCTDGTTVWEVSRSVN